jgi:hypothetical protein
LDPSSHSGLFLLFLTIVTSCSLSRHIAIIVISIVVSIVGIFVIIVIFIIIVITDKMSNGTGGLHSIIHHGK